MRTEEMCLTDRVVTNLFNFRTLIYTIKNCFDFYYMYLKTIKNIVGYCIREEVNINIFSLKISA